MALHPFCFAGLWVWDVGKKRVEGRSSAPGSNPGLAKGVDSRAQRTEEVAYESVRPVRNIQTHTDREFRRQFRAVCKGLIEKAKDGSTAHTRLLLEIGKSGQRQAAKRRGRKSLSEMLLDELKRRQDEREAAADRAKAEEQQANAKTDTEGTASVEGGEKE